MAVALLKEPPLALPLELGPYRRQDYEALTDEPRCELLFGRFYVSPSPSVLHQVVVQWLLKVLDEAAAGVGAVAFVAPLDVALDDHSVVQPDVLYVSAGRRGIVQERIEGAPDLVVEVVSPGSARRDRDDKMALYAQAGVREYWIVDPVERQIEFLVASAGRFSVALPDGPLYRSEILPEVQLDLLALWRAVDARLGRPDPA